MKLECSKGQGISQHSVVARLEDGQALLLQVPKCLLFVIWVCCASSSAQVGEFSDPYQVKQGRIVLKGGMFSC